MNKKLKKLFVTLVVLLSILLIGTAVSYASESPVIKLMSVPSYGSFNNVEGIVCFDDGTKVKSGDYRVAMFIEIEGISNPIAKPYYSQPYAIVQSDGSFSGDYTTGGIDEQAKAIHLFLTGSDYFSIDINDAKKSAIDYVRIDRTKTGEITVSPDRMIETKARTGLSSGLTVKKKTIGVNVGFYLKGRPGDKLSSTEVTKILTAAKKYANTVRIYSASGEINKAYSIANKKKLKVIGTAWISGDPDADKKEMDALIKLCNKGYVSVACVGSEAILRGDVTINEIVEDMNYVRGKLKDKSIPVTTADSCNFFMESSYLRDSCDIIFPNYYPFWNGIKITEASKDFINAMDNLKKVCGEKEIIVSETGWPTMGDPVGQAKPGSKNAARYYKEIRAWSKETGINVMFFSLADEKWKDMDEGSVGSHWGFLTSKLSLKKAYKDIF